MHDELEAARALAIHAGAILLEHYSNPIVQWKERGNPVTDADRAASDFLVAELRRRFPGDGILSEEERDDASRLSRPRVWIVDPLDGTVEFIGRLDEFSVMIGLAVQGTPRLGVVYQPTTEKLYYAAEGIGAFVTENRESRLLRVSPETDPHAMSITLSRSHHSQDIDAIQRELGVQQTVSCGSLGLKVGVICEARAHLYLNTNSQTAQWDTCAPDAILREAGGKMTNLLNAPLQYNTPEVRNLHGVVATNGLIHDRVVEAARSVLGRKR
jgi:3'(2'), 5'-bisphosphate nucleotidase